MDGRRMRCKMVRTRKTTLLLLAAISLCACKATSPGEGGGMDGASAPPAAPGESAEATLRASLQGHDKHGDAMRDAVVRGDLDGAKREAKLLTELRVVGPTSGLFGHQLDAMKDAAALVMGANDLKDASRDIGVVAKTCGDCHHVFGRPGMIVGQPAVPAAGVRATMQRHQWAAEQLWEGLVVPSDDAWNAGAPVMEEAPLEPGALTPGKSPVPRVGELAMTVHDLGHKAAASERVDLRADLYGQMLATCADCHKWLGGGPTPP
jgi:cytochrome c553